MYGYYRVDRIDYSITFGCATGNTTTAYMREQPTSTFDSAVETLSERPLVKKTVFNVYNPRTIVGSLIPWKVLGIPRRKYEDDPNYSATCGANPTLMAYLTPYFYPLVESPTVTHDVKLVFHCVFFQPLTVTGS